MQTKIPFNLKFFVVVYSIMFILLISLIIVPVILAKMPAKNEKYYEVLDEL